MDLRQVIAIVTLLVVSTTGTLADIKAITQDGRTVTLRENGTWHYVNSNQQATNVASPAQTPGDENAHWASIATSKNAADFQNYLGKYPSGTFASIARLRLKDLEMGRQTPGREIIPAVNVDDISAFNGAWDMKLSPTGDCDGVIVRRLTIKDGRIKGEAMHPSVGLYQVTGKIDRHGNFKGNASGSVGSGSFSGRKSSADGSGDLQINAGEINCNGSWTAKKKV